MQTLPIFSTRGYAHMLDIHLQNTRGEAMSRDLKEWAEDALWRPKIPVLLPILRFPRFRAHGAHAFTQRGRRRAGRF
jgi:hypothetical protein